MADGSGCLDSHSSLILLPRSIHAINGFSVTGGFGFFRCGQLDDD